MICYVCSYKLFFQITQKEILLSENFITYSVARWSYGWLYQENTNSTENILNKSILNKSRIFWFLSPRNFWLILPKIKFWREDLALRAVTTQFWDFLILPHFLRSQFLSRSATNEITLVYKIEFTRYKVPFYMRQTQPELKHSNSQNIISKEIIPTQSQNHVTWL